MHRRADWPLVTLVAVAAVFTAGLVLLMARISLPSNPWENCRTLAATLYARLMTAGMVTPSLVLGVVLLAGALALAHQLWATRRVLGRVLARTLPASPRMERLAVAAGLSGRVDLVDDGAVYTFCYGLRAPRVAVSRGLERLLDDDELLAVLRHEAHHAAFRDPLKILFSRTLASSLFFLPLAGALRNAFLAEKEICADGDARRSGDDMDLAKALVKMIGGEQPTWPAGVLAIGAFSPTEARIQHLLEPEESPTALPSATDWIVSAALAAGIFGFSVGAAAAAPEPGQATSCMTAGNLASQMVATAATTEPVDTLATLPNSDDRVVGGVSGVSQAPEPLTAVTAP